MKKTASKYLAATFVSSSLLVGGCAVTGISNEYVAAGEVIDKLQIGDTKQHVLSQLGKPHSVEFYKNLNEEAWTYYRLASFDSDLVLGFKDGNKVTSIGQIPFARSFSNSFPGGID